MALPSILIAMSLNHQSSGLTAVMVTMAPVFTCVIAHFGLPEERFTSSKIIGVTLSLAGVLMIAAKRETGLSGGTATSIIGLATSIVAALSGASSNVYARRFMRDFNPLHASSIRTFAGVVAITPFFIFSGNFDFVQISPSHYPPLIYSALVGYFTGNIIIFNIVKRHGASTASMAAFIMPIVALMLGALTLNEKVTLSMALGTALILLGLFFVLRQPMSKALG
jgi:drug/metabolite transporter (DMT)-like permease